MLRERSFPAIGFYTQGCGGELVAARGQANSIGLSWVSLGLLGSSPPYTSWRSLDRSPARTRATLLAPYFLKVYRYRRRRNHRRDDQMAVWRVLPGLRGRIGQAAPGVLQQRVVDDQNVLLGDDLAGAVRGEEGVVALPYPPPPRLDRLPVLRAERGVDGPLAQAWLQRAQQALVQLWFAVDVDGEAVEECAVDDWLSSSAGLLASVV